MATYEKQPVNMNHEAQKGFRAIFVGISEDQDGYLCYIPSLRETETLCNVLFDKTFASALAFTMKPYHDAMLMRPSVTYTPCITATHKQTGDVIKFAQFEEGNGHANAHDAENNSDNQHDNELQQEQENNTSDNEMPNLTDGDLSSDDNSSDNEDTPVERVR